MKNKPNNSLLFMLVLIVLPGYAFAYIGPGAGLSAIGTVLALVGVILLAILGFLWYPIKRLIAKIKGTDKNNSQAE